MDYLLKSSALLLLMYLGYALFLKRETFFLHNRWFLLVGILSAVLLPLIEIPVYIPVEVTTDYIPFQFQYVPTEIITQETPFNWLQLATYVYLAGVVVFGIQFLFQFGSLIILLLKNSKNSEGIYTYVIVKSKISPFSFFKWIVYNPELFSDDELQLILNHEKVHVRQWHSVDIICSRLACVAFWFNPICWFYHKSIQQNLEYIADDETQNTSASEKDYQALLLKTSIGNTNINLTSNFYNSLIKKRIVMLQKNRSKSVNRWKSALVIPFFILFLMSVNTKEIYIEVENTSENKITKGLDIQNNTEKSVEAYFSKNTTDDQLKIITTQLKNEGIILKVDRIKRNSKNIITNIKLTFAKGDNTVNYAVKDNNGISPFYFLSENDAMKVEAVEIIEVVEVAETPTIVETPEVKIEADTIAIIEVEPKQTVRANYTFVSADTIVINKPVVKANGNVKVSSNTFTIKTDSTNYNNNFTFRNSNGKDPIVILNGKRVTNKELKEVDVQNIKAVKVHKDQKAIELYGLDAKDGAIVITLKDKSDKTKVDSWGITVGDSKTFPEASKKQLYTFIEENEKPLIIVNNEILGKVNIKDFDYNMIESISVFQGEKGTELYGKKGKDGVIKIITKDNNQATQRLKKPNEIVTLSSMKFVDDKDRSKNATLYYINKNSMDFSLDEVVDNLKSLGITAKFSKLKRNKDNEIISIKVSLSDNNGSKSSATFKNNKKPIPQIAIGKIGGSLIASSSPSFQKK